MLKELESFSSLSVWEFDSPAGIVCFIMWEGLFFMLGSHDQTELTHIILY